MPAFSVVRRPGPSPAKLLPLISSRVRVEHLFIPTSSRADRRESQALTAQRLYLETGPRLISRKFLRVPDDERPRVGENWRLERAFVSVARGWNLSAPTPPPVVCPMMRGAAMVARRVAVPFCGRLPCPNVIRATEIQRKFDMN